MMVVLLVIQFFLLLLLFVISALQVAAFLTDPKRKRCRRKS